MKVRSRSSRHSWWHTTVISALLGLRQENLKFEAALGTSYTTPKTKCVTITKHNPTRSLEGKDFRMKDETGDGSVVKVLIAFIRVWFQAPTSGS